jgi:hypothetical protein
MEQRRLRLGDVLDDYCPRERRVTNHAIVAMVEDDIKQTRCTTCDSEHAYKGARVPRRRKKDDVPAVLYKEVLASMPDADVLPTLTVPAVPAVVAAAAHATVDMPELAAVATLPVAGPSEAEIMDMEDDDMTDGDGSMEATDDPQPESPVNDAPAPSGDEGPVHRPLIRATLPRPEGAQKDARPVPEFTIRQNARGNGHGGKSFRGGDRMKMRSTGDGRSRNSQGQGANGNRPQNTSRFGRSGRSGSGSGSGSQAGFRGGQPRHGGRKGRG